MPSTKKHFIDDEDYDSQKHNVRPPEVCVDYLSYRFDEMDLAASWRVVTKRKNDIVNGIRLENASWRTWAKHKNNLKTISPETLNWLKDSDVTWLYGPLHTVIDDMEQKDRFAKPKVSTTEETLGLMTGPSKAQPSIATNAKQPLKSALKKVTASDLLKRSAMALHARAEEPMSIREANKQINAFSPAVIATHRQPKLRFNQSVEQCVALSSGEEHFAFDAQDGLQESHSDDENAIVVDYGPRRSSIWKIAPTRLKSSSHSEHETDEASSLSSSASSTNSSGNQFPWLAHQDTAQNQDLLSSSGDRLNRQSSANASFPAGSSPANHVRSSAEHEGSIQWVGQTCVYETDLPSDFEDDYGFDDEDWDAEDEGEFSSPPLPPAAPAPASSLLSSTHPSSGQHFGKSSASTADAADISLNYKTTTSQHTSASSDDSSSNTAPNNQTVFSHIAQWASSYLWPKSF